MQKLWYQQSAEEVVKELDSDVSSGLGATEAAARLKKFGKNQLQKTKKINPIKLFFGQFNDVLIIVLIIAASVSLGLSFVEEGGSPREALLIFVIVIAIALVGFFNEFKAEKTVEALSKLVDFKARVKRDGKTQEVDSTELVPGDIVLIEAGQKVPADIRLIEASEMNIVEASLTGESVPEGKKVDVITEKVALGDQKNMLFAGTNVSSGSALGVVVETAARTEIGKIATLVEGVEDEVTPMQKKLDDLGRKLGLLIAAICVLVFGVVFFLVPEASDGTTLHRLIFAFTAAVALAVAAIPEGLAFVVRISLALGAQRMAKKNALVRKLSAVEALGSTDVICSDKTGTLTKGEMTVTNMFIDGKVAEISGTGYVESGEIKADGVRDEAVKNLLEVGLLCNNASLKDDKVIGDPTEGCLIVSAKKGKLSEDLLTAKPRVLEIPFSSERKMMSTVHKADGKYQVATKGALEKVLENCTHYQDASGKVQKLTSEKQKQINKANEDFAKQALRVLAFATKTTDKKPDKKSAESGLTFVGLQGLMDPPRKEVQEVIGRVQKESGMRVVMITGDNIETAKAIAADIGIIGEAISGVEIDELTKEQFEQKVEQIGVYARVNPEHKIRIVEALQKHGHQVAMTGDGVNDAPAIKAADIGIAMGVTGTDVSKEAADLILLDDQFLTIINAIEEGRGIFDNVRKFVNFLISCNIAEVITIVMGILVFNDLVLTAAQLLFINIVTDGLPAVALGSDPAQKNALQNQPKRYQGSIIPARIWAEIVIFGTLMSVLLMIQYWYNETNISHLAAVSGAFTAMVVYEMVRLVDIRTDYKIKWFSNPWLSVAIASSLTLQMIVMYFGPLANNFGVQPVRGLDWLIMLAGSVVIIIVMKALNPVLDRLIAKEETV